MACWDVVGKALNQPIYNLLGGRMHEKLRSYTYLYPEEGAKPEPEHYLKTQAGKLPIQGILHTNPEWAARRATDYVKQGFTAVKIDPAYPLSYFDPRQLSLEALDNAERVIKTVREAVGGGCDILIGTHGQMTTASAIQLAERLEPYHPLWFEEPVPPENRDEMARVARATRIPVATGERLSTKYEFRELLDKQAASVLQFSLASVGGILEAKKIAGMAEAYYAQIAPWMYHGPIANAASVQLDTCSPNFLIQECIEKWGGFHAEIVKEPIRWEDGYLIPPTKPGLGIELDEQAVAKYPYKG
jgi:galactonate dehydratase